jgi:hypothetical protein
MAINPCQQRIRHPALFILGNNSLQQTWRKYFGGPQDHGTLDDQRNRDNGSQ